MRKRDILSTVVILWMILPYLVPAPASAAGDPVGSVTEVKGGATVTRSDGQRVSVSKNIALYPGDIVTTEADGKVSFQLNQGDRFTLNEDAQVSLDELAGADETDTPPVLRLDLGYLWCKINFMIAKITRPVVHTPTAVLGVRGTEFEAVVAEDATSAVVVDAGEIEVEAEKEKLVLTRGQTTEVGSDEKIGPPTQAPPKDRRDWRQFRKKRAEMLVKNLVKKAPHIRKRFERAVERYKKNSGKITAGADRIQTHIEKLKAAQKKNDRKSVRNQLVRINQLNIKFRLMTSRFRKSLNRIKVIGRHTRRLETFVEKNQHRFSRPDLAEIRPQLNAVSELHKELKQTVDATIRKIRETYRELKKLKQQNERHRSKGKSNQQQPQKRRQ